MDPNALLTKFLASHAARVTAQADEVAKTAAATAATAARATAAQAELDDAAALKAAIDGLVAAQTDGSPVSHPAALTLPGVGELIPLLVKYGPLLKDFVADLSAALNGRG